MDEARRIKEIFAANPAVIYACRAFGDFGATFISENIKKQLGYTPEEFTQNPSFWADNIHADDKDRILDSLAVLFKKDKHSHEYRFRRADGVFVWMRDELTLIRDAKGKPVEIVGSWLDISDRKELELELQRNIRHKRDFIATAAHELRTPLSVIIGYLELLATDGEFNEEEKKEFIQIAYDKGFLFSQLLDDLLDVSRIEAGKITALENKTISVVPFFYELFNQLSTEYKNHVFKLYLPRGEYAASIDPLKIQRAITNIVSNATKYSSSGKNICLSLQIEGSEFVVTCDDEGCGLDANQIQKVFEPYYKVDMSNTAPPGSGLGLSIVKQIIDSHNGQIYIESEPAKGVKVSLRLPLSQAS